MPGLAEKYRPKKLDDIIGQEHVVTALKEMVKDGYVPHLLFSGPPGTGKTSTAYALAGELGIPVVEFNASDERGIDVIRSKIKKIAFASGKRIILLDEADNMTSDAQHALRRIMEKASRGTVFILTCNEEWKIIDPIKSRCAIFRFRKLKKEELLKIIVLVLKAEGAVKKIDSEVKKALVYLIDYVGGDARKALNLLDSLVRHGRDVTLANIKMLIPPNIADEALRKAIDGNFQEALLLVEDAFLEDKLDPVVTIRRFYRALKFLDVPEHIKIKLYMKLGDVERNIKLGCTPLIQFASFLATAWVAKHVPQGVKE